MSEFYRPRRPAQIPAYTPLQEAYAQEDHTDQQIREQAQERDYIAQQQREVKQQATAIKAQQAEAARASASQLKAAKAQGVETQIDPATGSEAIRRDDAGKPVWQAGFTAGPTALTDDKGQGFTGVPYRDPSGTVHRVPLQGIQRQEDATGAFYEFDITGADGQSQRIRRPEESGKALFKIDPETGIRFAETPDPVTGGMVRQNLGADPIAANQAALKNLQTKHAQELEQKKFQSDELRLQQSLIETETNPIKEQFSAAEKALKELEKGERFEQRQDGIYAVKEIKGQSTAVKLEDPQQIASGQTWMKTHASAKEAFNKINAELSPKQKQIQEMQLQRDKLALQTLQDGQRNRVMAQKLEEAAKQGAQIWTPEWQKRIEAAQTSPQINRILTAAQLYDEGSPLAAEVETIGMPKVPDFTGALPEPQVPFRQKENQPGVPFRQDAQVLSAVLDGMPSAARLPDGMPDTQALGIDDPTAFSVAPGDLGTELIHTATAETMGKIDSANNRIILTPEAVYGTAEGRKLAEKASDTTAPVYLLSGAAPMSVQQKRDYITAGTRAAMDKDEAAMQATGTDMAGIRKNVREGRISIQEGKHLLKTLHGAEGTDTSLPALNQALVAYAAGSKIEGGLWSGIGATPETRAQVVDRFMDNQARMAQGNLIYSGTELETARSQLKAQHAGKSTLAKVGDWGADTVKMLTGSIIGLGVNLIANAGEAIAEGVTFGQYRTSERGKLFYENTAEWFNNASGFARRVYGGNAELNGQLSELRNWAAAADPGEEPPTELLEKIAKGTFSSYHGLETDAEAKARMTSADTFRIDKDPALSRAFSAYLETRNPAHFEQLKTLLTMDSASRTLADRVQQYITQPRAATTAEVRERAEVTGLTLNDAQAQAMMNATAAQPKDATHAQAILKKTARMLGLSNEDAVLALDLFTGSSGTDQTSFTGYVRSGMQAPLQEIATEVLSTYLTAGFGKMAAKGVLNAARGATVTATRRAALGSWVANSAAKLTDDFARLGMFEAKFGQPLSKLQRFSNAATSIAKGAVADAGSESLEEGTMAIGEPGSGIGTVLEQGMSGALAAPFMVGGMTALALPFQMRAQSKVTRNWEETKKTYLEKVNERLAQTPNTKPFTPDEFEQAVALYGNSQSQSLGQEVSAAYAELQAAQAEALKLSPTSAAPVNVGNAQVGGTSANAAATTAEGVVGEAQGEAEAPLAAASPEQNVPRETPRLMAAKESLITATAQAKQREALAIEATIELRDIPEEQRTLFTAVAKAAQGMKEYTPAEARALTKLSGASKIRFTPAPTPRPVRITSLDALPPVTEIAGGRMLLDPQTLPIVPDATLAQIAQHAPILHEMIATNGSLQLAAKQKPISQPTASQVTANSPEQKARDVIAAIVKRSPNLKSVIVEATKEPGIATAGAWLDAEGKVNVHFARLTQQLSGTPADQQEAFIAQLLDEEIRHHAHLQAARALHQQLAPAQDFAAWRAEYYGNIWNNELTDEQRQHVSTAYGSTLSQLPDDLKAFEAIRMASQISSERLPGTITESILRHLEAVLAVLRDLVAKPSEAIKREIDGIKAILTEYGYDVADTLEARQQASEADTASQIIGAQAIPAPNATRQSPDGKINIQVAESALDHSQLVTSDDPLFPKALQPRDRTLDASKKDRAEMVTNLRNNPDQWKRYYEGSTTDTGRIIVIPLMENGQQVMENGKPMFAVISGNGRAMALKAARAAKADSLYQTGIRAALEAEGSSTAGMELPVAVAMWQPKNVQEAEALATASNLKGSGGTTMSAPELAGIGAKAIQAQGLLDKWAPDESGNALAESNWNFMAALSQAMGGIGWDSLNNRPSASEGPAMARNAMLALLLGDSAEGKAALRLAIDSADLLGITRQLDGIAAEAGNLLRLAQAKPQYDLVGELTEAIQALIDIKQTGGTGTETQLDAFRSAPSALATTFARSLIQAKSAKAVREMLQAYRQAAEAVDSSTGDMFGATPPTKAELLDLALDARPISQILADFVTEVGSDQHPTAQKIKAGLNALNAMPPAQRRIFAQALDLEAERHKAGVLTALEYQKPLNGQLDPLAAGVQRWLDSFLPSEAAQYWQRLMQIAPKGKDAAQAIRAEITGQIIPSAGIIPSAPIQSDLFTDQPMLESRLFGRHEKIKAEVVTKIKYLEAIAADSAKDAKTRQGARLAARRLSKDIATGQGLLFTPAEMSGEANTLLAKLDAWTAKAKEGRKRKAKDTQTGDMFANDSRDPQLLAKFGADWPHGWTDGFPNMPVTLAAGDPLLTPTHTLTEVTLPEDHDLVTAGLLPAGKAIPRKALHKAILSYFMKQANPLPEGATPTLFAMGGGGGAGKSTILEKLKREGKVDASNAVEINADEIKLLIPEYKALAKAGDGRAAAIAHEESSNLASELMDRLITKTGRGRYNVIYDATMSNGPKSQQLIKRWQDAGLRVHLIAVTIDPKAAIIRAALRGADSGRWVPIAILEQAHRDFNGALKSYLPLVDFASVYDNTPTESHEIASKNQRDTEVTIVNSEFWSKIDQRSNESATRNIQPQASPDNSGDPASHRPSPTLEEQPKIQRDRSPDLGQVHEEARLGLNEDRTSQNTQSEPALNKGTGSSRGQTPLRKVQLELPSGNGQGVQDIRGDTAEEALLGEPEESWQSPTAEQARTWKGSPVREKNSDKAMNVSVKMGVPFLAVTNPRGLRRLDSVEILAPSLNTATNESPGLRQPELVPSEPQAASTSESLPPAENAGNAAPESSPEARGTGARSRQPRGTGSSGSGRRDAGLGGTDSGLAPLEESPSMGDAGTDSRQDQPGEPDTVRPGQDQRSADSLPRGRGDTRDVGGLGSQRQRPLLGAPERNFQITDDTTLAEGGTVTRLRNNISAIKLLRILQKEKRNATQAEKETLAKYVGWGAISQVFDDEKARAFREGEHETRRETADTYSRYGTQYTRPGGLVDEFRAQADAIEKWQEKWGSYRTEIKTLLTNEEYEAAKESTLNAHYTAPEVIRSMWSMVQRMGFTGGTILEPAGGIGHFFGLMPESIANDSNLQGVELDAISGGIMQKLYPESDIQVSGIQDAEIAEGSVDLAISNVPFGAYGVYDPQIEAQGGPTNPIHNYFFAKALQKVKPGGLIAFITSSHTLDSNIAQRQWLAERADMVTSFRLPDNAFKANAGTEVVTDIIFLRKKDGSNFDGKPWKGLADVQTADGKTARINEFYAANPSNVLGTLEMPVGQHGEKLTVTASKPITSALLDAEALVPQDVADAADTKKQVTAFKESRGKKKGALIKLSDGTLSRAGGGEISAKEKQIAEDFMPLRDILNDLYKLETSPESTDTEVEAARGKLNQLYDSFRQRHGFLHKHSNTLNTDPDYYRTLGLEIETKPETLGGSIKAALTRTKVYKKADVFTKRVLSPKVEPTSADTVKDAMGISLGWRGRLDIPFIASLVQQTPEAVEQGMLNSGLVFKNPENSQLETPERYLSGNVRQKLLVARLAAEKTPAMNGNVAALEAVQPADLSWADISYRLGSQWIPAQVYEDFANNLFGVSSVRVIHHKGNDTVQTHYQVMNDARKGAYMPPTMRETYATARLTALDLLDKALEGQPPVIRDTIKDGKSTKSVLNPEATEEARQVYQKIRTKFKEWVNDNAQVQSQLLSIYNQNFNSHVSPVYDGQHLEMPWVANGYDLYPDKKNVVWRAIQEGNTLIAHGVGGGKTIIGTAIAMEMKRLGLAKKPLIVVHNATLEQFAATIRQMAPTARVLVANKKDLEGPKRKEFMGRIASGDWDAVVMAHSTFNQIPDDPIYERKLMDEMLDQLDDVIRAEGGTPSNDFRKEKNPTVKELLKTRNNLKVKISKLQDRKTDDTLNFQELGLDTIILDEAHLYKKIPFVTTLTRIAGIDNGASERGTALLTRTRYIQETNNGRGVFTMTGTPVTNTLGEAWNMVRMVRPELLKEFGVESFDSFVSTFASIESSNELRANGAYKSISRLSQIDNLPEWNRFFRLVADVKMGTDMVVKGRPEIKGGKPELVAVNRTPNVTRYVQKIKETIDWFDNLEGKEKRKYSHIPLVTYNAAKLAAIDMRLINPSLPDEAGSKVNTMLKKVMELYQRTDSYSGTQVIFADSFNPLKSTELKISAQEMDAQDSIDDDAATSSFNLYEDIKKKLIAQGVPAEQIATVHEIKNEDQRSRMFEKINDGRVRIVIGSTQRLGTGVNMQRLMIAAHHLDVPWTPAELEQRDGRVYRQGNIHGEMGVPVEIYRYGMKDTLDAALWQKLETKERFIKQALSGNMSSRSIEDDTGLVSLSEQKAILTGPLGLKKFELESKLREIVNEREAWKNRTYQARQNADRYRRKMVDESKLLPAARGRWMMVRDAWQDLESRGPGIEISGKKYEGHAKAAEALKALWDERSAYLASIANPETATKGREPLAKIIVNGIPVALTVRNIRPGLSVETPWVFDVDVDLEDGFSLGAASSSGWITRRIYDGHGLLQNTLGVLESSVARADGFIQTAQAEADVPFTRGEEFTRLQTELDAVMKKLEATPGTTPDMLESEFLSRPRFEQPVGREVIPSAPVPSAPERTPSAEALTSVGEMYLQMAQRPGVFALKITPAQADPKANATIEASLANYAAQAEVKYEPEWKNKFGDKTGRIIISHKGDGGIIEIRDAYTDKVRINSESGKQADFSTRAYQAIYTWALHNKKQVVPDHSYTEEGRYRRISQMLSSALRHGTTEHMIPHDAGLLRMAWSGGLAQKIGVMAWQEARIVAALQPALSSYGIDPVNDTLQKMGGPTSQRWTVDATADRIKALLDSKAKNLAARVGRTTAARALLLTHWLAQHDQKLHKQLVGKIPTEQVSPVQFLYSAPAQSEALTTALNSIPPIWRSVLQASMRGDTIATIAARERLSETAIGNILRVANGRLNVLLKAQEGKLKPAVQMEQANWFEEPAAKAARGRPDLALGAIPAVVAVDQSRAGPEEVTHAEMQDLANRMIAEYPAEAEALVTRWMDSGTVVIDTANAPKGLKAIVNEAQARQAAQMLMTAAAKLLTVKKALEGGDMVQMARFIDTYRNTGTEQARALSMRRDPFQGPAERHAMFIAEAMLTPPEAVRNEMRKNPGNRDALLTKWAAVAQDIKAKLKARGIDIDAAFKALAEEQAATPPQVKIQLNKADPKTRAVVQAILKGMTPAQAASMAGVSLNEARKLYTAFRENVNKAGVKAAEQARDEMLIASAPAQDYAAQVGLPDAGIFDDPDAPAPKRRRTTDASIRQTGAEITGTLDLSDPVQVAEIIREFCLQKSTKLDMMLEFWRASILSGPQTHVVNTVSGAAFGLYEATVKKMGAAAAADMARMFGMSPDAASLSDLPAMLAAVRLTSLKLVPSKMN